MYQCNLCMNNVLDKDIYSGYSMCLEQLTIVTNTTADIHICKKCIKVINNQLKENFLTKLIVKGTKSY
jgi:hypothetical protein